jgi:fido (protein-threonine AMPylation protein)
MASNTTEIYLLTWRGGPTQAERMVAALLRVEGYQNVEPQAPLGGPDGRADVLCDRGGYSYVAAAYFPPTNQEYDDIVEKFQHDIGGVVTRKRSAFAFFTNQRLTRGERKDLKGKGLAKSVECEIYDVERISGMLDAPSGYGLRAAYLAISMSDAEQIAYFASRESIADAAIDRNTAELRFLTARVAGLEAQTRVVAQTIKTVAFASGVENTVPPMRVVDPLPMGELTQASSVPKITQRIGPELLLLVHRLVCFELPSRVIGTFRTEQVSLAVPGQAPHAVTEPALIAEQVAALCADWEAARAAADTAETKFTAVAAFHQRFLLIHPFLDGNGRTARALLMQQCLDLFGHADMSRMDRSISYHKALLAADAGDLAPLSAIVAAIVAD